MRHVLERDWPSPHTTTVYDERARLSVDLFAPTRHRTGGAVILIHGGFWRAKYDRMHLRPLAAALARTGRPVALPEYRRVGDPGGGWPGTLDDVLSALRHIPAYVGASLSEVTIVGHSAGGHLAALATARPESTPARLVTLAGVLDIRRAHTDGLSDGAVGHFLGTLSPTDAELDTIDPMRLRVPDCPVTVVHGTRDVDVPYRYSSAYAARDPRVRLVLSDADHYDLIDPLAPAFSSVLSALSGEL